MVVRWLDLQLPRGEVYLIQYYVIKFVSDLRQVGGFLWVLRIQWFSLVSSTKKTHRHDITDVWYIVESDVKHHNPNPTPFWPYSTKKYMPNFTTETYIKYYNNF